MPLQKNIDIVARAVKRGGTFRELADDTGLSVPCVKKILLAMHAQKLVHIEGYPKIGCVHVASYKSGPGEDAKKPPKLTLEDHRERHKEYRRQAKQRAEEHAEKQRSERIRQELARPAFRDPFIAALFGPYEARA
jgi:hypothetical protein